VHQSGGRSKVDRDGGWMSLANMRRHCGPRCLMTWHGSHRIRSAARSPRWCGTHVVLRRLQQQLSHAKLATTEAHYLQRQTSGADVRVTLDRYAAGQSSN